MSTKTLNYSIQPPLFLAKYLEIIAGNWIATILSSNGK